MVVDEVPDEVGRYRADDQAGGELAEAQAVEEEARVGAGCCLG